MRTEVIMLPVSRKVVLRPRRGRLHETHGRIVDVLPVEVEDLGDAPIAVAFRDGEGSLRETYVVHEGRSYVGRIGDWANAMPEVAADMLGRQLAGYRDVVDPSTPPEEILDGGHFGQEEGRQSLEDLLVLARGRLYERAPVPRWGYMIDQDGRVQVGLVPDLDDWIPSWQAFSVGDHGDVLRGVHLAEAVAGNLRKVVPGKDWRRLHPEGVVSFRVPWTVEDAAALRSLSYEDGGAPGGDEAHVAYATDLVTMLEPDVGRYPDAVLIQFAFLRQALAGGGDVPIRLSGLVAELSASEPGRGLAPAEAAHHAEAIFTLRLRLGIRGRAEDGEARPNARGGDRAIRPSADTARLAARLMRSARLDGDDHEWQGVVKAAEASGVEIDTLRMAVGCSRTAWTRWSNGHSAPSEPDRISVRDGMLAVIEVWASDLESLEAGNAREGAVS